MSDAVDRSFLAKGIRWQSSPDVVVREGAAAISREVTPLAARAPTLNAQVRRDQAPAAILAMAAGVVGTHGVEGLRVLAIVHRGVETRHAIGVMGRRVGIGAMTAVTKVLGAMISVAMTDPRFQSTSQVASWIAP